MPECPSRAQQLKDPVGKIVEGNKKLVRYELVGKECLPVFDNLSIPDQIVQNIPSARNGNCYCFCCSCGNDFCTARKTSC